MKARGLSDESENASYLIWFVVVTVQRAFPLESGDSASCGKSEARRHRCATHDPSRDYLMLPMSARPRQ